MPLRYLILMLGLFVLAGAAPGADPEPVKADEKTLRDVGLSPEGPALLEFFRSRTLPDDDRDEILALIRKMGDESFHVREEAYAKLLARGPGIAPLLRQAKTNPDIEIVRRAERCLAILEKKYSAAVASASARLLAVRKPEGTVEVLLGYLPYAEEETVIEEVRATLAGTGLSGGQPDKALLDALTDKVPIRRAVAAEVLVRNGSPERRAEMHRFLKDTDTSVRVRVGLALIDRKDREAVPALIGLLAEATPEQCWRVEDVLYRLAGEQAPNASPGTTEESRKRYRDAWLGWWNKNGKTIDLAKLDEAPRLLGHTLMAELINGVNGRVREVGKDGKTRWSIDNVQYPVDAQLVGADRVLIVEYTPRRVTERDFKGNTHWTKQFAGVGYPLNAQRLPNGNTFITTRNQLLEVDKNGKETVLYNRPNPDIAAGVKLRDGQCVFVTQTGQCVRLDAAGKEVKTFAVGSVQSIGSNIDALPSGRVLVPLYANNKVVEYDAEGKAVWEVAVNRPTSVARLPNGNTLIGCSNTMQVVEVDRGGREVSQSRSEGRLMRVRLR